MKPTELLPLLALSACNPGPHGWIDKAEEMPGINVEKRFMRGYRGLDGSSNNSVTAILSSVQSETVKSLQKFENEVEERSPRCEVELELKGHCYFGRRVSSAPQFTVTCWDRPYHEGMPWDKKDCESSNQ